jgi:ketosteroid isomerase-like protein
MMSANKATIEKYIEGFRQGDHASILGCLAEDVVWDMPACTYERSEGDPVQGRFWDVFDMEAGKIKRLTSYLMMVPAVASPVE